MNRYTFKAKNLEKENKELNEKINVYIRKNERLQQQLSKQEKRWNDLKLLLEEMIQDMKKLKGE